MTGAHLHIFEMGPRDGLQNERVQVSTADKVALVDELSACGFPKIEVTSFVSPKAVPQMADAAEVMAAIHRRPGCVYTALTPNMRGYEAARAAGVDEVAVFGSASEGFSRANINCSIEESFERFEPVVAAALADRIPVRGYVSCVFRCPYDGEVAPKDVLRVAAKLLDLGCYEISLGDTIGAGTADATQALLDTLLGHIPADRLAGHFHDTGGRAIECIAASWDMGLRCFDSAIAGLGGCPYAPGSRGNVATEMVVDWAHGHGIDTGIDTGLLAEAANLARSLRRPV